MGEIYLLSPKVRTRSDGHNIAFDCLQGTKAAINMVESEQKGFWRRHVGALLILTCAIQELVCIAKEEIKEAVWKEKNWSFPSYRIWLLNFEIREYIA